QTRFPRDYRGGIDACPGDAFFLCAGEQLWINERCSGILAWQKRQYYERQRQCERDDPSEEPPIPSDRQQGSSGDVLVVHSKIRAFQLEIGTLLPVEFQHAHRQSIT